MKAFSRFWPVAAVVLLVAGSARAADEKKVKMSVESAIEYLKKTNFGNGAGGGAAPGLGGQEGGYGEGPAALAGIALLEAGVPADDPSIQAIAKIIREAAIKQHQTYQLSLDIIFLDKLGETIDTTLIQSMAVRVRFGQHRKTGGWGYNCPGLDENEKARLSNLLNGATLKGGKELPQVGSDPNNRPKLDSDIEDMLKGKRMVAIGAQDTEDNSNTQFAVLGLWAARRHGIPVEDCLQLAEQRFRHQQPFSRNGGWAYVYGGGVVFATPPMTCAGLLGLAVGTGMRSERRMTGKGRIGADGKLVTDPSKDVNRPIANPLEDPNVKAGLAYLANVLNANGNARPPMGGGFPRGPGGPGIGPMGPGGPPPGGPVGGPIGAGNPGGPGVPGEDLRSDLYFLWSLERVCMVFGLSKIGNRDWHDWGASYLITSQMQDGSWRGKYGGSIDTAFALMFLCRSNIVRDLSKELERTMKSKPIEPGGAAVGKPDDKTKITSGNTDPDSAAALSKALLDAGAAKQIGLIKEYTSAKGGKYSLALADAIPKLTGEAQGQARDALAERMSNLSANTLKAYFENENPELRRAAALGAAMREEKSLIGDLIELLDDTQEIVWRAAALSLRDLTGKDFGPKKGATDTQRRKAIADWRAWNKKEK